MKRTFEDYLIMVGIRSSEYTYTDEQIFGNSEYFKKCYKDNLSAYKALLFLYDHLNEVQGFCDGKKSDTIINRYFLVAYIGTHPLGKLTGFVDVTTKGQYLNRRFTIENIKELNKELSDIVITNIIEITKEDFNSWNEKSQYLK